MPKPKFNTELCDSKMTFDECELTILRQAIDTTTEIEAKKVVDNENIRKMIMILENFLIRKKCICYGGTAINNILPKDVQFYDKSVEIPDYDFFSKTPIEDAKELSDLYYNQGFSDVEAKSGVHKGTYKIFVNFIPIADITSMIPEIYDNLEKEAITILGIRYCPPNYLRMSMYLELSRPQGDVSRWEKVMKRLNLLNKHHPLKINIDCKKVKQHGRDIEPTIFSVIRDTLINQKAVFFGGYAVNLYSKYMPPSVKRLSSRVQEFDVLVEEHNECAIIVKERLEEAGFKKIKLIEHDAVEDIIPKHIEVQLDGNSYAFIYEPIACHNYNVVTIDNQPVNIATIDTMLSFYLAFTYLNDKHYNKERILCLAKYLYEVEEHNRLEQHSILKRFSAKCVGKQRGLTEIRAEKSKMYKNLSKKKYTKEYDEWFFKYVPSQLSEKEQAASKKKIEKYIAEDAHILKKSKEDDEYGTEVNPKSIIMKYKSQQSKSPLFFKKSPSNKTYKKRKEEEKDKEEEDESEEEQEEQEYKPFKKDKYTRKWNNKTHKKSTFWKRFNKLKKYSENKNKIDKSLPKSEPKWFGWF
jgi:hypothetical protein